MRSIFSQHAMEMKERVSDITWNMLENMDMNDQIEFIGWPILHPGQIDFSAIGGEWVSLRREIGDNIIARAHESVDPLVNAALGRQMKDLVVGAEMLFDIHPQEARSLYGVAFGTPQWSSRPHLGKCRPSANIASHDYHPGCFLKEKARDYRNVRQGEAARHRRATPPTTRQQRCGCLRDGIKHGKLLAKQRLPESGRGLARSQWSVISERRRLFHRIGRRAISARHMADDFKWSE